MKIRGIFGEKQYPVIIITKSGLAIQGLMSKRYVESIKEKFELVNEGIDSHGRTTDYILHE